MKAIAQAWPRKLFVDDFPGGQRQAPRCEVELRVSLRFSLPLLNVEAIGSGQEAAEIQPPEMMGVTRNLSEIGLAISAPSNQIDHRYLNVVGCKLDLTLDLPTGPIQMQVTTRWCQKLLKEEAGAAYHLGLRITRMSDEEWVSLVRYIHASV